MTKEELRKEIDKLPRIKVGNSNSPTVKYCIDEVLLYDLLGRYKEETVGKMTIEEARNELVLWRNRNSDNNYYYKFVEALTIAIKALEYIHEDWEEYEKYCKKKESEK